jgi:hypothetical protein
MVHAAALLVATPYCVEEVSVELSEYTSQIFSFRALALEVVQRASIEPSDEKEPAWESIVEVVVTPALGVITVNWLFTQRRL